MGLTDEEKKAGYPEHAKLLKDKAGHAAICEFIDFLLDEKRWAICELGTYDRWQPIRRSRAEIVAAFYDVDMVAFEEEKQAMLDKIRAAREKG